jgi:hypothetical protein
MIGAERSMIVTSMQLTISSRRDIAVLQNESSALEGEENVKTTYKGMEQYPHCNPHLGKGEGFLDHRGNIALSSPRWRAAGPIHSPGQTAAHGGARSGCPAVRLACGAGVPDNARRAR